MTDKEILIRLFEKSLGYRRVDAMPAQGEYLDTGEMLITGNGVEFMIGANGKCMDISSHVDDLE